MGLAIKLSLAVQRSEGDDTWQERILVAAQKDAERLAGGVLS